MIKIKVIDLLNKIANGEEVPEKIKIGCSHLTLNKNKDNYIYENRDEYYGDELIHWYDLDTKVEIIEEDKKIEKIDLSEWAEITYSEDWKMLTCDFNRNSNLFVDKINEIIDYINGSDDE